MSKTTLSILSSVLLGTAIAWSAPAMAVSAHHATPTVHHFHNPLAHRFAEPAAVQAPERSAKKGAPKPVQIDPGSYTVIDEPEADPSLYGTRVFGINENGLVTGQYVDSAGAFHGFACSYPCSDAGSFTTITVDGDDTFAYFSNDKGEIFGAYVDSDTGIENAWIRHPGGRLEKVMVPGGTGGTTIQTLNNKGVSTGDYVDSNGAFHGFIRDGHGNVTTFDDPLGGTGEVQGTNPIGINIHGEVSGIVYDSNDVAHGFIRDVNGNIANYDVASAGTGPGEGTSGLEITDDGWITGGYVDANDVSHGFLRKPDGTIVVVDAPDGGTGQFQGTVAVEHLEANWAVGEYVDADDVTHGFYCTKCEKDQRKVFAFDPPGASTTYTVFSSNKQHWIAGTYKDENGIRHGFVRLPH